MILAKKKKAQVMVLDVLVLFIIVLLIISIEEKNITNYGTSIKNKNNKLKILEQELIVDKLISDCNYLAQLNNKTKICYSNIIDIKNITQLNKNICYLSVNSREYMQTEKEITNSYKRGVIYKNTFSIIEVGFCEK